MLAQSRVIARRAPTAALRRNFTTTRPQFGSPYHYPEGPRSNIPFNPLTRFFAFRYWAFMGGSWKSKSRGMGDTDRENSYWIWTSIRHCW